MRTVPPGWETDDDLVGFDTDDTQSIGSEWEVSSSLSPDGGSDMADPSDASDGDSAMTDTSDAESDCTAMPDEIPDEAFDFDTIEAEPTLPPGRQVDNGENDAFADERLADRANWPELWSQVSLDSTGPFGFVSDNTSTPASVAAYGAEGYVTDVDVQPHLFAHCRGARAENRLGPMPNVETLRLFVQYTDSGPTVHGPNEGQLCPTLCGFAPSAVVLRGMSLVFDDIPLEIWIPRVLDRMNRLILVLDPGPTGEQWRRHARTSQPTEMANAGIVSVLRALPNLDLTIVFNARPGEIWDSDCNPVIINALGHLLSSFAGTATIVNLESVTSHPKLDRQRQIQNLNYLQEVRYGLNRTIFERSSFSNAPQYLSMRAWLRRCRLSSKAVDSTENEWDTQSAWAIFPRYDRRFFEEERERLAMEARHQPHPPMVWVPPPVVEAQWAGSVWNTGQPTDGPPPGLIADPNRTGETSTLVLRPRPQDRVEPDDGPAPLFGLDAATLEALGFNPATVAAMDSQTRSLVEAIARGEAANLVRAARAARAEATDAAGRAGPSTSSGGGSSSRLNVDIEAYEATFAAMDPVTREMIQALVLEEPSSPRPRPHPPRNADQARGAPPDDDFSIDAAPDFGHVPQLEALHVETRKVIEALVRREAAEAGRERLAGSAERALPSRTRTDRPGPSTQGCGDDNRTEEADALASAGISSATLAAMDPSTAMLVTESALDEWRLPEEQRVRDAELAVQLSAPGVRTREEASEPSAASRPPAQAPSPTRSISIPTAPAVEPRPTLVQRGFHVPAERPSQTEGDAPQVAAVSREPAAVDRVSARLAAASAALERWQAPRPRLSDARSRVRFVEHSDPRHPGHGEWVYVSGSSRSKYWDVKPLVADDDPRHPLNDPNTSPLAVRWPAYVYATGSADSEEYTIGQAPLWDNYEVQEPDCNPDDPESIAKLEAEGLRVTSDPSPEVPVDEVQRFVVDGTWRPVRDYSHLDQATSR